MSVASRMLWAGGLAQKACSVCQHPGQPHQEEGARLVQGREGEAGMQVRVPLAGAAGRPLSRRLRGGAPGGDPDGAAPLPRPCPAAPQGDQYSAARLT